MVMAAPDRSDLMALFVAFERGNTAELDRLAPLVDSELQPAWELGVSTGTADWDWATARSWLGRELSAA